jgi:transcriptional regulator with XRE-family HTH domain
MATEVRIGTTIRRARERKRMSQEELGAALGVSRSAVNAWENDRAYPRNSIGALEEILDISLTTETPGPVLTAEDDWERQVLSDQTLPRAERRDIVLRARKLRASLYPAPQPARDAGAGDSPDAAAG